MRYATLVTMIALAATVGCLGYDSAKSSTNTNSNNDSSGQDNSNNNDNSHDNNNSNGNDDGTGGSGVNADCSSGPLTASEFPFIWKPISESDGNLVIVFDETKYPVQFISVKVGIAGSTELEEGRPIRLDDGRQGWRFSKPGSAYSGRIFIEDEGQECEGIVADPANRDE